MKVISKLDYLNILTKNKEYEAFLIRGDDEHGQYDVFEVIGNTGERWLFYSLSFYTEQELHEKNFHSQLDELLK